MKKFVVFRKEFKGGNDFEYEDRPSYIYESEENDQTANKRSHLLAETKATSFEVPPGLDERFVRPVKRNDKWEIEEDQIRKEEFYELLQKREEAEENKEKATLEIERLDEAASNIEGEVAVPKLGSKVAEVIRKVAFILKHK